MAKKRGPGRPKGSGKKKKDERTQHTVPSGFWRQVGAVFLIIFGLIALLGLLGVGGAFPVGLADALLVVMGWAAFVLPLIFIWQAVQIFRAENNRVSPVTWFATVFFLWFVAGIFQLFLADPNVLAVWTSPLGGEGGGFLGWLIDAKIFAGMFDVPVMALILSVLCLILLLFVLAVSPLTIFAGIKKLFGRESDEAEKANKEIARKVAEPLDEPAVAGKVVRKSQAKSPVRAAAAAKPETVVKDDSDWHFPGMNLLNKSKAPADPGDIERNGATIINTLAQFDIQVVGDVEANVGPRVTQYAFRVKSGTKLRRITALDDELKSALQAKQVRIEAPIAGRQEVGVEVPNSKIADVRLYDLFQDPEWVNRDKDGLLIALGRDTNNKSIFADLTDSNTSSILIAGQSGSGKSVMINSLLMSLLYSKKPSELRLIMADPKSVELGRYKDIPHLLTPIIDDISQDPTSMIKALTWAVQEMEKRYKVMSAESVLNIKEYNDKAREQETSADEAAEKLQKMPRVVMVLDEMADLMMSAGKEVEKLIIRLAQKGRAAGIHIILATQRPDKNVVPGLIKGNIQATIAFAVRDYTQSGVILGGNGAEKLLGKGDMLLQTADSPIMKRIQGALVSNDEVNKVASFLKIENGPAEYDADVLATAVQAAGKGGVVMGGGDEALDPLFREVAEFAIENGELSGSNIVTNFSVGYGRSARILAQLEKKGVVGQKNGTKPREVLVGSLDDVEDL
ncbi:MAG: DNA translocase FtsK [Candidatus Nomurabacteria bacterium]|nr:DNA translocase FtsK [Candidatus Nomurabacteria bacterium]